MAPVEHQHFYLDPNGGETARAVFITEKARVRTIRLKPVKIILKCSPKDKYALVQLKGDTTQIKAHILNDQVEEDISGKRLERPVKIKGSQHLIITSQVTNYSLEIRHHPSSS